MNDDQNNYKTMADTNIKFMDDNNAVWTADANIPAVVIAIKGIISEINITAGIQSTPATGATKEEHKLWEMAVDKGDLVDIALKAYYKSIGDITTFDTIDFTVSKLLYTTKPLAIERLQKIYNAANSLPAGIISGFGITPAILTDLNNLTLKLAAIMPVRTTMVAGTSAATKELKPLYTQLREQYDLLDTYTALYKYSNSTFFLGYKGTRKIYNYGKTQTSIELVIEAGQFVCVFKDKFAKGNTLTFKNNSESAGTSVDIFLTNDESTLPTKNGYTLNVKNKLKTLPGVHFGGVMGRFACVHNTSFSEKAKVTIILAHGKSGSKAKVPSNITPVPLPVTPSPA